MKKRFIATAVLMCATCAGTAAERPSVEVFAGWSWEWLDRYSYRSWGEFWDALPYAGFSIPLYRRDPPGSAFYRDDIFYPYYGWGFGAYMRIPLHPFSPALLPEASFFPPPAGSAPLLKRSLEEDARWDADIELFMRALSPPQESPAESNAPPATAAP